MAASTSVAASSWVVSTLASHLSYRSGDQPRSSVSKRYTSPNSAAISDASSSAIPVRSLSTTCQIAFPVHLAHPAGA